MTDRKGVIYIIKNFANDKIYVGKTINTAQKRFGQHLNEAFTENSRVYNYCLSRAIRKYGIECFDYAILADNVPEDDLDLVEEHYIRMYDATNPNIGYNMSSGGYDTSNHQEYREIQPGTDYDTDSRMNFDDIDDDLVNEVLNNL